MSFKMVYEFDTQHYFVGPTMIPVDRELSATQTEVAPNSEKDNYWTGTDWIHREKPTPAQQLAMQQEIAISQLRQLIMNQQQQIMQLKGSN
ncbi:hypothetical protein LTY36_04960 [Limosilactobacillus agrestis]|uniref:Uncharacterized protein n=1 Tax=Limosilactobacillus agrestis TaxID=2759748 RepID=A0ABS8RAM3_9LACO|nr:hypothetical protein [Limosilactobacillus agrestis]MBB1099842.1 hypothetical protein [Limosilactobacillus agrestis]MCD7126024.1 hypothetical protein [Limosilactobacillus agrestis]MCD7130540.1 hypothetical protein [Limosilactobacillus agrestis]